MPSAAVSRARRASTSSSSSTVRREGGVLLPLVAAGRGFRRTFRFSIRKSRPACLICLASSSSSPQPFLFVHLAAVENVVGPRRATPPLLPLSSAPAETGHCSRLCGCIWSAKEGGRPRLSSGRGGGGGGNGGESSQSMPSSRDEEAGGRPSRFSSHGGQERGGEEAAILRFPRVLLARLSRLVWYPPLRRSSLNFFPGCRGKKICSRSCQGAKISPRLSRRFSKRRTNVLPWPTGRARPSVSATLDKWEDGKRSEREGG